MKEEGKRYNEGKVKINLLPTYSVKKIADVFTFGAEKYGDYNWMKGMAWSKCFASLERHLQKAKSGIDNDEESGLPHLAHLAANAMFLLQYSQTFPQGDDRQHYYYNIPKIGLDIDDVVADFCSAICEKLNISTPVFWNTSYKLKKFIDMNDDSLKDFYLSLKPKFNPNELLFEPTCYITSRPVSKEVSEQWIEDNGFPCVPVYSLGVNESKVEIAKQSGIDIFIDDKYENFVDLNRNGITTYLLTTPHNARYDVGDRRINHVNDIINRIKNIF